MMNGVTQCSVYRYHIHVYMYHAMEYDLTVKKNKVLTHVILRINFINILLCEIR